jgi:signal-transduction protein with cAMP-binding, CBS, and nucleotidyltransferase domain
MDARSVAWEPRTVADLQLAPPVWLDEHATLLDVARMMTSAGVSVVIVGRDAAIVTERDLVRALACDRAHDVLAVQVATHDTLRCPPSRSVVGALAEMLQSGLRHLVIVDPCGVPSAVLTLGAAAAAVLEASAVPTWLSALRIVLRVEERDR